MILPNLHERIAYYQEALRPEDPRFGTGIADWTITSEYVDDLEVGGEPVWGCMGSPSTAGLTKLTPEDIEAKRAHIAIRTPTSADELAELERTLLHESGHVLAARLNLPRAAEEEFMHSLDNLFGKLTPEQGLALARAFQNPMARAYRAKEGGGMADPTDNEKEKPAGAGDKAPMKDGEPRDVAVIEVEIAKAKMAGQPIDQLAEELALALVARGAQSVAEPVAPLAPEMGLKPDAAYARVQQELLDERKSGIEAVLAGHPHLDDAQKSMVRKQGTAKAALELAQTYPRAANGNEPARMGMQGHPSHGGAPAKRAITGGLAQSEATAMARQMGVRETDSKGPHIARGGIFVLGHMGPTQVREKMSKGWDPRNEFPATVEG